MRCAAHVPDAALRVPASQSDEFREYARERARARETILVDPQPQIAVGTRGVGRQHAGVQGAHRFRVLGGAERMAVLLALPRAIPEGRRQPEIGGCGARARERQVEQRIDARRCEIGRIARRRPPDVRTGLEYDRRRIRRVRCTKACEIRGGAREVSAIQGVETCAQIGRALQHHYCRGEKPHVSGLRR